MDFFWGIGLQSAGVLTSIFGILGLIFSLALIVSPKAIRSVGSAINRRVEIDEKITSLDRTVGHFTFSYTNTFGLGICLMVGSSIALIFFLFNADVSLICQLFFSTSNHPLAGEYISSVIFWSWSTACVLGALLGALLLFVPSKAKTLEDRMNASVETGTAVSKLNRAELGIDDYFFRHPVMFGTIGMLASVFILVSTLVLHWS